MASKVKWRHLYKRLFVSLHHIKKSSFALFIKFTGSCTHSLYPFCLKQSFAQTNYGRTSVTQFTWFAPSPSFNIKIQEDLTHMHCEDLLQIYVIDAKWVLTQEKNTNKLAKNLLLLFFFFSLQRTNAQVLIYLPFVIIIIKQISHKHTHNGYEILIWLLEISMKTRLMYWWIWNGG